MGVLAVRSVFCIRDMFRMFNIDIPLKMMHLKWCVPIDQMTLFMT